LVVNVFILPVNVLFNDEIELLTVYISVVSVFLLVLICDCKFVISAVSYAIYEFKLVVNV